MMETTADERQSAYDHGYNQAIELSTDEVRQMANAPDMAARPATAVAEAFDHFTGSARWANVILPKLRRLAGFDDRTGAGTYTAGGDDPQWRLDELVEAYRDGHVDKTLGYDRYSSRSDLPAGGD